MCSDLGQVEKSLIGMVQRGSDQLTDISSESSIIKLLVLTGLGSTCLWATKFTSPTWWGFQCLQNGSKILSYVCFRGSLSQGGTTACLDCSSLVPSLLLFPAIKYLNLPFGTQVKSWRLNDRLFPVIKKWRDIDRFCIQEFQRVLLPFHAQFTGRDIPHQSSLHSREEELNSISWVNSPYLSTGILHRKSVPSLPLFTYSIIHLLVCTGVFCLCLGLSGNIIIYFFGQIVQHDHGELSQEGEGQGTKLLKVIWSHMTKLVRTNKVQGGVGGLTSSTPWASLYTSVVIH